MNYTPLTTIPDISFWQDNNTTPQKVDFVKMKNATDEVIIRAGQRNWVDEDFIENWRLAKAAGLQRGSYWFYDSRESPQKQADIWKVSIGWDLPERGLWIDLEESYGGAWKGEANWKRFAEAVRAYFPNVKIGIYTGYGWWAEQTVFQADYWSTFPLWLASYNPVEYVTVPSPWKMTGPVLWQYSAKGDGPKYGVESWNIDLSYTCKAWFDLFGGEPTPAPQPPPTGGIMKGTVQVTANIRDGSSSNVVVGKVYKGDIVYGEVKNFLGLDRLFYTKVYRLNGTVEIWAVGSNTAVKDGTTAILTLSNEAEPVPPPSTLPDLPVTITLGDDVKYVKQTVNVTLKPKA
jgi:GH25 family lysozyme M1 (1,4-beta-N-acetylmuramidase)